MAYLVWEFIFSSTKIFSLRWQDFLINLTRSLYQTLCDYSIQWVFKPWQDAKETS